MWKSVSMSANSIATLCRALLLSLAALAAQWNGWNSTTGGAIEYRWQVIGPAGASSCVIEFRDQQQRGNLTKIDVSTGYKNPQSQTRRDTVAILSDRPGRLEIANCSAIEGIEIQKIDRR